MSWSAFFFDTSYSFVSAKDSSCSVAPEERSFKRLHAVGLQVKSAAVYVSNKIPPPFPFVPIIGLLSKRALK